MCCVRRGEGVGEVRLTICPRPMKPYVSSLRAVEANPRRCAGAAARHSFDPTTRDMVGLETAGIMASPGYLEKGRGCIVKGGVEGKRPRRLV